MKRMESRNNCAFQWFEAMEHLILSVVIELISGSADMLELVALSRRKSSFVPGPIQDYLQPEAKDRRAPASTDASRLMYLSLADKATPCPTPEYNRLAQ